MAKLLKSTNDRKYGQVKAYTSEDMVAKQRKMLSGILERLQANDQTSSYIFGATGYGKVQNSKSLCARRMGARYNREDDVYECITCNGAFGTKEDYKEHDCDEENEDIEMISAAFHPETGACHTLSEGTVHEQEIESQIIHFGSFKESALVEGNIELNTLDKPLSALNGKDNVIYFGSFDTPISLDNTQRQDVIEDSTHDSKGEDAVIYFGSFETPVTLGNSPDFNKAPAIDTHKLGHEQKVGEQVEQAIVNVISSNTKEQITKHATPDPSLVRLQSRQRTTHASDKHNENNISELIHKLTRIVHDRQLDVHFVGKRRLDGRCVRSDGKSYLQLQTKHTLGIQSGVDCYIPKGLEHLVHALAKGSGYKSRIQVSKIKKGWSGFILQPTKIIGQVGKCKHDFLVVRGSLRGKLIDACTRVRPSSELEHYSAEQILWKNFEEEFVKQRLNIEHECTSDVDVSKCGLLAATLVQLFHPCGKITCAECISNATNKSAVEYTTDLLARLPSARRRIEELDAFPQVLNLLTLLEAKFEEPTYNSETYAQILQSIGHIKTQPFDKLNDMNSLLANHSGSIPNSVVIKLQEHLLEVVRYTKKRTDSINRGEIRHYRNKIASKAHFNLDLMCDNQLDRNGNFMWGERGYHAKRFFLNYFDIIDPTANYSSHVIRRNPNGSRKLATGRLIVSTNFEAYRENLKGDKVHTHHITEECVSRDGRNFVYSCSCVTHEDGSAVESHVILPTKNHLVIGNSGGPKYIDLPTNSELTLYIAKEGYCYINIFLAMLVNVRESQAKTFTKMVRDVLVDKLGKWPTMMDVATACSLLTVFYPDTITAELPRILVDHNCKSFHVIDSYGSLDTGFHILKANTVNQILHYASTDLQSELKHYRVGGRMVDIQHVDVAPSLDMTTSTLHMLITSIYKPKRFRQIIEQEPFTLVLSVLSPAIMQAMLNNKSFEQGISFWIHRDRNITQIMAILQTLARRIPVSDSLQDQMCFLENNVETLHRLIERTNHTMHSRVLANDVVSTVYSKSLVDKSLLEEGFINTIDLSREIYEKNYQELLQEQWREQALSQKLFSSIATAKSYLRNVGRTTLNAPDLKGKARTYTTQSLGAIARTGSAVKGNAQRYCSTWYYSIIKQIFFYSLHSVKRLCPDLLTYCSIVGIFYYMVNIFIKVKGYLDVHKSLKEFKAISDYNKTVKHLDYLYGKLCVKLNGLPSETEFLAYIDKKQPSLKQIATLETSLCVTDMKYQAKGDFQHLEKMIALLVLLTMLFDANRSDAIYKILNKFKGVMSSIDKEPMLHQSLDDIQDIIEEKNLTVDFNLTDADPTINRIPGATFSQWWRNQIERNRMLPHYRSGGHFLEFTRANASSIASTIAHEEHKEVLIRGAVGSGKSTSLPFQLHTKGSILLLEPTRPLAENVYKQLKGAPFFTNPTFKMRGLTQFGSSPITVMTSGFAFQYYANNVNQLRDFDFIMFDECHCFDAQAMAFFCLLKEHEYEGKILKVSATPPGREVEFTTQFPVDVRIEGHLSHQQFVNNLGTGANSDILPCGDNILIYVASYNEVDQLSKLLMDRKFKVTKVDGRTMKSGKIEIITEGTSTSKHFIVATNIIENGVTLDVDVVVDFATKVVPELDEDAHMIRYNKKSISYGERIQRMGRVGRHKRGTVLKIGETEKSSWRVPPCIATEAAFYCFAYGLPVISDGVSTSLLENCTVPQARTMMQFELSIFFMFHLVKHDGSMHPVIHDRLKQYKLRDSEIVLNKTAIPHRGLTAWPTVEEMKRHGCSINQPDDVRLPFFIKDVPDKLYGDLYEVLKKHSGDACFGKIRGVSACKIAYTLQTDPASIQRTIKILDKLYESELQKKAYFANVTSSSCSSFNYALTTITNAIRARHMQDYTTENLSVIQNAKSQLLEFNNIKTPRMTEDALADYGALECMMYQSENEMSEFLKLKGRWNKSVIIKDIVLAGVTVVGGALMIFEYVKGKLEEPMDYQGKNYRQRQRLRFREAHDSKHAYEIHGDDAQLQTYFGNAYTKKGKKSGNTVGAGKKMHRFYNIYGFEPTDYSFARYVDPLTGATLDESTVTDLSLVQDHFGTIRSQMRQSGDLEPDQISRNTTVECYYVNDLAKKVLKIDLTPHNPLRVSGRSNNVMGFPERSLDLRQSGAPVTVPYNQLPPPKRDVDTFEFEGKSLLSGLRDYNPVAACVCKIANESDGVTTHIFGIGYGPYVITNQHLFRRNNGLLRIYTHAGEYLVNNACTLKMHPIPERDIVIIRLPKDFTPFPQRLKFRPTRVGEHVCLVSSNFQTKSISSVVSETSSTAGTANKNFFKHWITTKHGQCGNPLVSVTDGSVVGIHSMASTVSSMNMYAGFPDNFVDDYLSNDLLEWTKGWKLSADRSCWDGITLVDNKAEGLFKLTKEIFTLDDNQWEFQSGYKDWMYNKLEGNLKAVGRTSGNLVTKHSVKGKCMLFQTYLSTESEEAKYFTPLMGAYSKSALNKEAYIKDLSKYSGEISVGNVNCDVFERAFEEVVHLMESKGFHECAYITNEHEILAALNMKAAVGALYSGKKREYFADFSDEDKREIVKESCKRLFLGKMGVWNGSLKAELRPIEKVLANKTRSFTAAPLDTLLGGKVCVDDFNNQFYSRHFDLPWTVGMSKFRKGWDTLLRKLPEDWVYCDADGSQFDSSLSPYLINAVLKIRLHFMEDWDVGETMLRNLYTEIVYTPIATPDGTIVKKFKGNNSGQPSTVVDNSLMVVFAMYYAMEMSNIEDIHSKCVFFVNGDDLLIAVEPGSEIFLDSLQNLFHQLGLNYNFDSRTRNKEELCFMSHMGVLQDGIYIPKLDKERIVSILEWDRAQQPEHRLEAICAAMIEAWGYPDLLDRIRKFYCWVLEQAPYSELSAVGKAPFISEMALRNLYTDYKATEVELARYLELYASDTTTEDIFEYQAGEELDAGTQASKSSKGNADKSIEQRNPAPTQISTSGRKDGDNSDLSSSKDRDVNVGTTGTFSVPRIKQITQKGLSIPMDGGKSVLNLDHLLQYKPSQLCISNTRATRTQFKTWRSKLQDEYGVSDSEMSIILNGLMVWCIENGTSPNINGVWTMMDGEEQVEFPLRPVVEHAQPTLRQIMTHFSALAEAYIEMRNSEQAYMPRYGLQRNLTDMSLARYAFDFYEVTSRTPVRAREAHAQMKAAALRNSRPRLFGLDGNVTTMDEDTERHTAHDVNARMHHLDGAHMQ
uniref:Genome polyprotein n=1 Tax=Leek yellow stripe virus TaxID=42004 RepID=A0A6M2YYL5_9POTV|nr:polyprotein [Leek yellow stripe virus]